MLLVMKGHKVDQMAKKKIGASLVTSMIADYMKATTDAPSTHLATTLGLPPVLILSRLHVALCIVISAGPSSDVWKTRWQGMEFDDSPKGTNAGCLECHGQGCSHCHPEQTPEVLYGVEIEGHEPEEKNEFLRRAKVVYNNMFEEHSKCPPNACPGHGLPPMASKFLAKLKYPTDAVHSTRHVRRHDRVRAHTHTCTNVCCVYTRTGPTVFVCKEVVCPNGRGQQRDS